MSELPPCEECGRAPCRCTVLRPVPDRSTDVPAFSLLPSPTEVSIDDEERYTGLLREVKVGVLQQPSWPEDAAGPLLARARRLDRLIQRGDLARADELAAATLQRVLEFPRRSRGRGLWWVLLPLLAGVVALSFLWLR